MDTKIVDKHFNNPFITGIAWLNNDFQRLQNTAYKFEYDVTIAFSQRNLIDLGGFRLWTELKC